MLELAISMLKDYHLCDHCLGRQVALVGYGLSNNERGKILKNALVLELFEKAKQDKEAAMILQNIAEMGNILAKYSFEKILDKSSKHSLADGRSCHLCQGLFVRLDDIVKRIVAKLENEDYQSFLVGAKFAPEVIEREDDLRAKYKITTGESIKSEFTREIGKKIMILTEKEPDFHLPDITIVIDLVSQKTILQKRSLYLYGRYNKFIRTIPQTRWPCYDCKGIGCIKCDFTGKRYQVSIEELIAEPILKITGGIGSKFHGAGREDINALMLGNGRPFVLEIQEPKIRSINLKKVEKIVNRKTRGKVKISSLSFSNKRKVQEIKSLAKKTRKTYRALVELDETVSDEQLSQLEKEFRAKKIKQQTPRRVLHRRADLERPKTVHEVSVKRIKEMEIEAEILGEGGLYIKELISGDDGRTIPSFASILGCKANCKKLDVIYLHHTDD